LENKVAELLEAAPEWRSIAMKISPTHRLTRTGSGLIIELRKPRTLNALDLEDFLEIDRLLDAAERDESVRFLAIWAPIDESPRAFCAGGDIRRLHDEHRASGTLDHGSRFFRAEYRVDQRIWNFPKPVIALTHGLTMGGGIGLIRGAPIRVACESSIWAMPEISIGLYPDVGATYFLSLLPEIWAAFIALTGARLGIDDVMRLGLATHRCLQADLPDILEKLERIAPLDSAATIGAIENALAPSAATENDPAVGAPTRQHSSPAARSWSEDGARIASLFGGLDLNREAQADTAGRLWSDARKARDEAATSRELRDALDTMLTGSPASFRLILEQLRLARRFRERGPAARRASLQSAIEWEYAASLNCMQHGDFFEGVRSRLVDKDFLELGRPRWKHSSPGELRQAEISALFPSRVPG
jgi:enoyl-CoA hydratase